MSEESPKHTHPRILKPRVSFSAEETEAEFRETGGVLNRGFTTSIEENVETIEEANDEIELSDIPMHTKCSKRRVSVTPAGDAVIVRNGEKSYRAGEPVLNGFSMTVPCGSIYGLLGSSGCGKTTALSCIVGILKLDKGDVWLFGERPGNKSIGIPGRNIGYMPQDISMYQEFSILETLTFFGTLSGMTQDHIKSSKNFLLSLLDLPMESRRVGSLSGGEQRRVSFAAALIHEPELLILDEPTVGVDPLIRQKIWDHLRKIVSSKRTTIIITTHYIEECRQADNVGIMRSGRLLAERPPQELMSELGSTNLEKIVLLLARKDTAHKLNPDDFAKAKALVNKGNDEENQKDEGPDVPMAKVTREPETAFVDHLVRIKALAGKNFAILFRNPLLLFFVLLIAAVLVVLIGLCFGPDPKHMRVGLVNHELDHLLVCPNITRVEGECNVENLSCHYLKNVPEDILDLRLFENENEALEAVHKGSIWGYIMFSEDFSTALYERSASGANLDEVTFNASEIIVRLDETNKQISAAIKKALYDGFEDFIEAMLFDCGFDPRQGESALLYKKPIFGRDDTDFREFLAPGAALALLFFFPIITTSIRYIKEKKNGVYHRSMVQGVKTWEVLIAYSISEFCVLLAQAFLNYVIVTRVYGIKILGTDLFVILLWVLSAYGGVSMGFLLGAICTEEIQAAMIAMAAFFPNFILSGLIWPIEGMEVWLQYVVQVLPCTFGAEAVRSVTSRGWEFTHPHVWPGFVMLAAYIIGYFVLTILFHVIFKK